MSQLGKEKMSGLEFAVEETKLFVETETINFCSMLLVIGLLSCYMYTSSSCLLFAFIIGFTVMQSFSYTSHFCIPQQCVLADAKYDLLCFCTYSAIQY